MEQLIGSNIIGVVMCGGLSKRMGFDKGLIKHNKLLWAQIIKNVLDNITPTSVISINQSQLSKYKTIFPDNQLIVDSVNVNGPLRGILSVHNTFPNKDLLVLACDMINMKSDTLKTLYKNSIKNNYDFYVYQNNKQLEPLCALYSTQGLRCITRLMNNRVKNHSLKYILSLGKTKIVYPDKNTKNHFVNFNSVCDINSQ